MRASPVLSRTFRQISGVSRGPALIHVFDYIVFTYRKSSVSGPAGSIQGEYAHELVELTTLHYWGSEGTGVERPRFGRGWRIRLWPIKGRGPFEVHRKLLWVVVCRCILCSIFLGGSGIVVGRGDSLFMAQYLRGAVGVGWFI